MTGPVKSSPVEPITEGTVQQVHVLVDLENNQPTLGDVRSLVPDVTHAWLFHSRGQAGRLASFEPLGQERTPVPISRPGKNALDFHLAFYLGYIAARNPKAKLVIVAIDKGYGPMVEHAVELGFEVVKVPFRLQATPGKKVAVKKSPAKQADAKPAKAAPKKTPTKNATTPSRALAKKSAAAGKVTASMAAAAQPAAKVSTPPAKMPAPGKATATRSSPAGSMAGGKRVETAKVAASLKKMGDKRPKKVKPLRRHLASLLGTGESDSAAQALLDSLVSAGSVRLDGDSVAYR
jgi:hypothetical protein